jgi:flavodoxin
MAKVLVVYYSRSGYTRRIASEIAARCGADLDEIRDTVKRAGFWGYWRSGREALRKELPAIATATKDPAAYDVVAIGTPVWAGSIASPVRSWLAAHAGALRRVAFFCTKGGSGEPKTFAEPLATLMLTDAEIDRARYAARLDHFVAGVAAAAQRS